MVPLGGQPRQLAVLANQIGEADLDIFHHGVNLSAVVVPAAVHPPVVAWMSQCDSKITDVDAFTLGLLI